MGWIKRNLYFVIGSVVALLVMGGAGYYLYSKSALNNDILKQLDEQYAKLSELNRQNPHPGEPGKVDNVQTAKDQQKELRDYVGKVRPHFQTIRPIPDMPKLSDAEFSRALTRTIAQMQTEAANASVSLPPKAVSGQAYGFSFQAQRDKLSFAPGSLVPLSVQLGEVKAICDVLFQAKVNSLDNLRREMVSADDSGSSQGQTDYLARKSVTNELAIMSPYEITFRGFSSELAAVLAGFASSPYGIIVKSIHVEVAGAATEEVPGIANPAMSPPSPGAAPAAAPQYNAAAEAEAMRRRYGISAAGGGGESRYGAAGGAASGGVPLRGIGESRTPYAQPTSTPAPTATPGTTTTTSRGGLPTVLDEKPLKVTLTLDVVKLLPTAKPK